jgi:chemotaxis signal transduction protein
MTERASELRDAFDHGFAAALPPPAPAHHDYLCIRVGGQALALALDDVSALHADLCVIAVPSRAPELVGVAAVRAAIVPIYDLRLALGGSSAALSRWTVLVRGGTAGFAFDGFDRHARIADHAIARATQGSHVRGQFTLDGQPRTVVDLGSVLAAIETRWRPRGTSKDT